MKKAATIFIITLFLSSCGIMQNHLKQNLSVSYQLSPGMSKAEVEQIMGNQLKVIFQKMLKKGTIAGQVQALTSL